MNQCFIVFPPTLVLSGKIKKKWATQNNNKKWQWMSEKKLLPFLLVSGMDATFSMTYSLTHIKKTWTLNNFLVIKPMMKDILSEKKWIRKQNFSENYLENDNLKHFFIVSDIVSQIKSEQTMLKISRRSAPIEAPMV